MSEDVRSSDLKPTIERVRQFHWIILKNVVPHKSFFFYEYFEKNIDTFFDRSLRVFGVVHSDFDTGCTRDGMFGFWAFRTNRVNFRMDKNC